MTTPLEILQAAYRAPFTQMRDYTEVPGRIASATIKVPYDRSHGTFLFSTTSHPGDFVLPSCTGDDLRRSGTTFVFAFPFSISCAELDKKAIIFGIENRVEVTVYPPFDTGERKQLHHIDWTQIPNAGPDPYRRSRLTFPLTQMPAAKGLEDRAGLRIDMLVTVPANPAGTPVEDAVVGDPRPVVAHLLRIIRYRTRQWWVGRDDGPRRGPITGYYPIAENRTIRGEPVIAMEMPQSFEVPKALDTQIWLSLMEDIETGYDPPLYDDRLLDAYYFTALRDTEAAALAAAQVLEIARTHHLTRLANAKDGDSWDLTDYLTRRRDLGRKQWNLAAHLDDVADDLVGSSFRRDHPAEWEVVANVWKTRGQVAHGKHAHYVADGTVVPVGPDDVASWFPSIRTALRWLEAL